MKKKLGVLLCAVICFFSLSFAGCSAALSDEDKELLNNAYETGSKFVENENRNDANLIVKINALKTELANLNSKEVDENLLEKLDNIATKIESSANKLDIADDLASLTEEIATAVGGVDDNIVKNLEAIVEQMIASADNSDILEKLVDIANNIADLKVENQEATNEALLEKLEALKTELANLKEEKVLTQEEIKYELLLKMKEVLFQEKNYRMDITTTDIFKGNIQSETNEVYAYYYNKESDVQKIVLAEKLGINTKLSDDTYTTKEYDLKTGLEITYDEDEIYSSVVTLRTCDPLNNLIVGYYYCVSNENDGMSSSQFLNVVYSIDNNGSNVTYRVDFDMEYPSQTYPDPMTFEFTFEDNRLTSYTIKGFSTERNIETRLVCEITYDIPEIQVEDYLL